MARSPEASWRGHESVGDRGDGEPLSSRKREHRMSVADWARMPVVAPSACDASGLSPFQFLGRQGHRFRERRHGAGGSSVLEYPLRLVRTVVAWVSEPVAVVRHQVMRADTGTKYRTAFTRQW